MAGYRMTERTKALRKVAKTQSAFWDALGEFERLVNKDLNSTADFTGYTIATDKDVDDLLHYFDVVRS